jgi:hypothetical protein
MLEFPIKFRVRATPPTLVRYTEVHAEDHKPRSVSEIRRQLHVSTPLTSSAGHLRCLSNVFFTARFLRAFTFGKGFKEEKTRHRERLS